jgi:magnesium-transporting ATPase (P-type)
VAARARRENPQVGDPLDQKLFAASEWELHDNVEASAHAASAAAAEAVAAKQAQRAAEAAVQQQQQQQLGSGGSDLLGAWPGTGEEQQDGSGGAVADLLGGAAGLVSGGEQQQQQNQQQLAAAAPPPPALGWVYPPAPPGGARPGAAIVRRFEFSSALQRNAVVVREAEGRPGSGSGSGSRYVLYAKGSPEMIRTLVDPSSVPEDFDRVLGEYTREVRGRARGMGRAARRKGVAWQL